MDTRKLAPKRVIRKLRDAPKPPLHFLHISKAGGTAIRSALEKRPAARFRIIAHGHSDHLPDIPEGQKVFFVVRDPVTRFVSGFNSRLRKGGATHPRDWSPEEEEAFNHFATADDLARAIGRGDPMAYRAVDAITHLRWKQVSWVGDLDTLRRRRRDVLFVGRQWALDEDFGRLAAVIGLRTTTLPMEEEVAHRTPAGLPISLSSDSIAVLREWYADDYTFLAELARLGPDVGFTGDPPVNG